MVKVTFYSLLRSKYHIKEEMVKPGSIHDIIDQIIEKHPEIKHSSFRYAVVFYKGNPVHYRQFKTMIDDGENIYITHFVSGG